MLSRTNFVKWNPVPVRSEIRIEYRYVFARWCRERKIGAMLFLFLLSLCAEYDITMLYGLTYQQARRMTFSMEGVNEYSLVQYFIHCAHNIFGNIIRQEKHDENRLQLSKKLLLF